MFDLFCILMMLIVCAYLVYRGIKGLRASKNKTVFVEARVTEIRFSHSGYEALVEYEYEGIKKTRTIPTRTTKLGGLKKGDLTSIKVYEGTGEQYLSALYCWFMIIFGSGVIIFMVGAVIRALLYMG